MNSNYKPSGYNSLSPYFVVDGAQKMIDLLTELFNAKELRRYDEHDGTIMHVEIQIDDSIIMIGDSSEQFPPNNLLIHLYISNVDEVFNKAIDLGCISMETPREREGDPDRRGTFKDFAGNIWSIAIYKDFAYINRKELLLLAKMKLGRLTEGEIVENKWLLEQWGYNDKS